MPMLVYQLEAVVQLPNRRTWRRSHEELCGPDFASSGTPLQAFQAAQS